MAIPPVAPMIEAEDELEDGAGGVSIACAAGDCKFNKTGKCGAASIKISAGANCETYEPGAAAPQGLPTPPMPPAPMM